MRAPPTGHGYLKLFTVPWSRVYLDGRSIGITPLANVRASAGKHRLRFVNPQIPAVQRTVVVRPGQVTKLRLRLR